MEVWRWAQQEAPTRQITGIVAASNGSPRALVIAYGPVEKESILLVPIDDHGKPAAPFAYNMVRTPSATSYPATLTEDDIFIDKFLENVTHEQQDWLENRASIGIHMGKVSPTTRAPGPSPPQGDVWFRYKDVGAIGYKIDSQDQLVQMKVQDALAVPAHCYIVLVPPSETRLNPERVPAAILATPFTLALDAVWTPIVLPIAIIFALAPHSPSSVI